MLDLDNQQYLGSGMQFGTSELINAVLDHKLSAELDQGLQISDPAVSSEVINFQACVSLQLKNLAI